MRVNASDAHALLLVVFSGPYVGLDTEPGMILRKAPLGVLQ